MIIQSSNNPLIIYFSDDMTNIKELRITLWMEDYKLKVWGKSDLTIENKKVTAPLTQDETKDFPKGRAKLEIKWLTDGDKTEFAETVNLDIVDRRDKEVMNYD